MDFEVLRRFEVSLAEDIARTEVRLRFPPRAGEGVVELFVRMRNLQAAPAPSARGFDRHGIAVFDGELSDDFDVFDRLRDPRNDRHAGFLGNPPRPDLVAEKT